LRGEEVRAEREDEGGGVGERQREEVEERRRREEEMRDWREKEEGERGRDRWREEENNNIFSLGGEDTSRRNVPEQDNLPFSNSLEYLLSV
jgi:hypothetical protein